MKQSKINICYFIGSLNIGGTERNMINIVKNIDKSKFNVFVYVLESNGPLEEELKKTGIPYSFGRFYHWRHWYKTLPHFIWFLIKNRIQILHSLGYPVIYYGVNIGRLIKIPILISTIQDYDYWKKEEQLIKDKKVYKYVDKIIADGKGAMEFTIKQQGVGREKFEVIYDGVNPDELKQTKNLSDLRKELGITKNNKIVGVIARLDNKKKGQEYFLKAVPEIIKKHPMIQFLLVGDKEPDRSYLERIVKKLNLTKKVIFVGPRTDLGNMIKILDILVIPSNWESVPKILLEAMYLKKTIIATQVGDIPEILQDNKNGFLVKPKDPKSISQKINYCLENPKQCQELGKNAHKTIICQELLLEKSVKKLENLYQRLRIKK